VTVGDIPDSSYMTRLLKMSRTVICAAPSYLARRGNPETPDDLAKHNCICNSTSVTAKGWPLIGPDNKPHVVKVAGNFRTNSVAAQLTAAIKGHGIVLVPTYIVTEELADGRLVALLGTYGTPEIPIRLIYPSGRLLSSKVRTFIDYLMAWRTQDALSEPIPNAVR
jgi:DNA-binding transcriptional LysR family regulator